ncbi:MULTISPECIES: serine--tRNA ligase [Candidatus Nitrosocaldus]|jgi:seryl-tRNA synthetase|uniref:Serine--tRNA ligase n=1 Tax=Candidatus Nitrosocaldus cavascurensis TaxID=2058097 RepID=A0A2K5APW9_9ARCH|nr:MULTISPECIES: serine--tRNA ligase [Candidatus Nitrosocaldus]SPC33675.1 Serine--tRNA ligase [Candidatus Nitrosocaldus cavascurensis]
MIDPKILREQPNIIAGMLERRRIAFPLNELLEMDKRRRMLMKDVQELNHRRNVVAQQIAAKKRLKQDTAKEVEEMKALSERIDMLDRELYTLEKDYNRLLMMLPNLVHESVPDGDGEEDNVVVREWGEPRRLENVRGHVDIGLALNLLDLERAAKISGSRFYFLLNDLVLLNHALIQYALEFMKCKGFTLVQTPYMIKRDAMEGAIMLSDFEDVIYKVEGEDLYLIGTAEHAIAAMHMDEILDGKRLPLRYAGISPCFRKEAGAHGKDTKGIFRVHQFEKVEQFIFCKPEQSWDEHELLLKNAEEFFQMLEIPYRVVLLCSAELGKVSAKTYDIEAWMPAQGMYREVVSCSNCLDFQARRLKIRYRDKPNEETRYVHTLNSTLVATERTLVAMIENNQSEDGKSIIVPKVLRPYMNGIDSIPSPYAH